MEVPYQSASLCFSGHRVGATLVVALCQGWAQGRGGHKATPLQIIELGSGFAYNNPRRAQGDARRIKYGRTTDIVGAVV